MLAIDSATMSFAFIVCQSFNVSTNEDGLRIYSILYSVETKHPLVVESLYAALIFPLLHLLVPNAQHSIATEWSMKPNLS